MVYILFERLRLIYSEFLKLRRLTSVVPWTSYTEFFTHFYQNLVFLVRLLEKF